MQRNLAGKFKPIKTFYFAFGMLLHIIEWVYCSWTKTNRAGLERKSAKLEGSYTIVLDFSVNVK